VALAVSARTSKGISSGTVAPCGNCRQVIAEEEYRNKKSIRLILDGKKKIIVVEKGADLLPIQFNRESLKVNSR
jgi:cytidine deaminase